MGYVCLFYSLYSKYIILMFFILQFTFCNKNKLIMSGKMQHLNKYNILNTKIFWVIVNYSYTIL